MTKLTAEELKGYSKEDMIALVMQMLNTPRGAQSSAILYSIAETAKANNLKPYEYFRFLLDEIAEHLYGREHDPNERAFLNDLLPWSDKLPDVCKKKI